MEKYYFYTDANGNKQGPYSTRALQHLATEGKITATTPLETDDKRPAGSAGQLPGLKFGALSGGTSPGFFDIGFTHFITNTWTSILWVLTIIIAFLGCVGAIGYAVSNEAPILILIAPIAAALFLLLMRMTFELEIVVFRIETRLRAIEENSTPLSRIEGHLRAIRENTKTSEASTNDIPKEPQV